MNSFSGKTALVTGATGLIGSHLVDALMQMGSVNVIALSRNKEKLEKGFAEYVGRPNFQYIAQDVATPLDLEGRVVDYIFHAAGPISGSEIKSSPVNVITPNLIGTINLLEFLHRQEIKTGKAGKIIIFSSATIYGHHGKEDLRVSEPDTCAVEQLDSMNAPYSQSKRMIEVIAQAYRRQYNLNVIILRFGYVYGYTRFPPNTAFYAFVNSVILGKNIIMQNSGIARRDNIYIDDAISGILLASTCGENGQVYNISSNAELGNFAAIDEIGNVMIEIANQKYRSNKNQLTVLNTEGLRAAGIILDNTKLKSLGWHLRVGIKEGIEKTFERFYIERGKPIIDVDHLPS